MRSCFVLLFASLLTSCEAQGTIETPVFVLKGRDLLLELHADPPEGLLYVEWKINKTVTLVRFNRSGKAVTGRLELGGKNFSVILKNLQEADSGVYSAELVTNQRIPVSEYKVTVQGPVSPVELIVDRVDSSSSESCDLHVTCRTHNSHISSTFKCPKGVCSQEGGERSEVPTSGASLQVYLLNTVIICNHSNQVNWTQDLIHAEPLCPSKPDPPLHSGWVAAICILILIIVVMILVLIVWLYNRQMRIIRSRRNKDLIRALLLEERDRQLLDHLNKKADSGETMEELDRQLLDLLNKKTPSGETMTDYELQLLDLLNKEAASRKKMEEHDLQLLNLLNKKAASGEKMRKRERRLLEELNKKATSREMMKGLELQLLDRLNKKKASGEKMTDHERQLLDLLNEKKASGEMMEGLERQLLVHLNKESASEETMEDGE